ncbi:hypothetical protein SASPL_136089 [Salvia splendens]|uniref:Uncharacterized protein n=1 Tax=Salvia splendens TaxID=180675 RepID=A0A8X8WZB3_SALSN|nr:hypothetical protein SASPL_136089 [Salvia splendens]
MLSCLKTLPPQGDSVENTPRSSARTFQTIDLTREYTLTVRTSSYGEILSTFDPTVDSEHLDGIQGDKLLEQVLQPSLSKLLVYASFSTRKSTRIALHMLLYMIFLITFPWRLEFDSDSYSLSDSQCNLAYNVFLQFDRLENPFISNASQNFDDMRQRFSQLTHGLNHHPVKPRSRVHLPHYRSAQSALCLIATAAGMAKTAIAMATNALVALAGSPICFALFPSNMIKKERGNLVLLDEASRSAYVLRRDLDTIDCMVSHLYEDVEYDKFSIHHALEREMDKYLIQQIMYSSKDPSASASRLIAPEQDENFLVKIFATPDMHA